MCIRDRFYTPYERCGAAARLIQPVFPICLLQRRDINTTRSFPARLVGDCRSLANQPLYVTPRPQGFPLLSDGTTVTQQGKTLRPGGDIERLVGERAAIANQPCRKGASRVNVTTLEEAYGEYWLNQTSRRAAPFIRSIEHAGRFRGREAYRRPFSSKMSVSCSESLTAGRRPFIIEPC